MFTTAIVKLPCTNINQGETQANLGQPVFDLAFLQHQQYTFALEACGLEVIVLEGDDKFPDSTFIEDVALCTPECAVITNPGINSRKGEEAEVEFILEESYDRIERITSPGTIEAGDIMMVGSHFYIGLSNRTNLEGANQMTKILERYGMTASTVQMNEMLHLKTGLSYVENNKLLITGEFLNNPVFDQFEKIIVPQEEAYAANSVWINDFVLIPEGYPKTKSKIEQKGYEVLEVDVSEFRKLDGGLSCLSLRF